MYHLITFFLISSVLVDTAFNSSIMVVDSDSENLYLSLATFSVSSKNFVHAFKNVLKKKNKSIKIKIKIKVKKGKSI